MNSYTTQHQHRTRAADARAPLLACSLLTLILVIFSSLSFAEEPGAATGKPVSAEPAADLISLGDATTSVSVEDLGTQRAKALLEIDKVFLNEQELNGSVSGNVAIGSQNGANTISGDAFSNASGVVNTIQNTGNNVLIQSATIVNVSIED